jgi:biotin carboxyl carrier protein
LSVIVQAGPDSGSAAVSTATRPGHVVRAPAVGRFHPQSRRTGEAVGAETIIGAIRSVGRETAVAAGIDGSLQEFSVTAGDFVEYGQPLATVSTGKTE